MILKSEEPQRHKEVVDAAGEINFGLKGALGAAMVMQELMKRPENAGQRCATRLVTW